MLVSERDREAEGEGEVEYHLIISKTGHCPCSDFSCTHALHLLN